MKTRLHKIKVQNFKALRDFSLDLEGRHLLVYGANGSGKSSLYWARPSSLSLPFRSGSPRRWSTFTSPSSSSWFLTTCWSAWT